MTRTLQQGEASADQEQLNEAFMATLTEYEMMVLMGLLPLPDNIAPYNGIN